MDSSVNTKGNFQPKQNSGAVASQVANSQNAVKSFFGTKAGKVTAAICGVLAAAGLGFGGYKIYKKRMAKKAESAPAAAAAQEPQK